MCREEIAEIVTEFRESICEISDEEVEDVLRMCKRKMEITGKEESYLKLLLPDELKNHVIRRAVNATTILRWMEELVCV